MRRSLLRVAVLPLFAFLLVLALTPDDAVASEEEVSLTGVVRAAETDSRGKALRIYLATKDEGSVLVSKAGKEKELRKQVGATVSVKGYLRPTKDNPKFAKVLDVMEFTLEETGG